MSDNTATKARLTLDVDLNAARRSATGVFSFVRDYIPQRLHNEVLDALTQSFYEGKVELTSFAMRKEWEAWKGTQIELGIPSFKDKRFEKK